MKHNETFKINLLRLQRTYNVKVLTLYATDSGLITGITCGSPTPPVVILEYRTRINLEVQLMWPKNQN